MRSGIVGMALALALASCTPPLPETYPLPADTTLVRRPEVAATRGTVLASGDTAYWDYQVTRAAAPLAAIVPEYSEGTRMRAAEGRVLARFAVNELGAPVMSTFYIVASPDYALSDAVRQAVAIARFRPAELHGRPVVQIVEMPFNFTLTKP